MNEFLQTIAAELPEEIRGRHVVLGVSGGADSICLLRALMVLRDDWRLELHVAHLNHGLRGQAADDDAAWLEALCGNWEVPFHMKRSDISQLAAHSGDTIEEAARKERYLFLESVAGQTDSDWIAVAHTADDQVETILHHLLRGTGIAGLRGMPRCRPLAGDGSPKLVRPLLSATREQVEAFLNEIDQEFRRDETNLDERFTRNRLRHQLLPQLRRDFNPEIDAALLRLGRQAAETDAVMTTFASRLLDTSLESSDTLTCRLNVEPLAAEPRHLVRECFRLLWTRMNWPRQRMGFDQWDRLAELIATTGSATFPGRIHAERRGCLLVLRKRNADS